MRKTWVFISLWTLVFSSILIACGSSSDAPSTESEVGEPVQMEFSPTVALVPTQDPGSYIAGEYHFRPGEEETADHILVLNADHTALLEEQPVGSDEVRIDASGSWTFNGSEVIFNVKDISGESVDHPEAIKIQFVDGFPIITEIKVADTFIHLEDGAFSLGAGEQHPLVRVINQRLAAIPFLNYTDPETDTYSEGVRQAVVAFQESQGLLPDGVVDSETWILLENPKPYVPTPTPAKPIETAPLLEDLPTHTDDGHPILYLSFDDGPDPNNTPALLDLLEQYNAKVTFFNIGKSVSTWPELVRESASRGHYIADHTWDHGSLEGMSHTQFIDEVGRTRQAILDAAGDLFTLDRNVRYVRPPYGATDNQTYAYASELGMTIVLWNVDPQDWRRPGADVIATHVVSHAYPGAIILSHDGGGDRSQTIEAYRTILPQLQQQGYEFRTIFLP